MLLTEFNRLKEEAKTHNSEFHHLLGPNEMGLPDSSLQKFSKVKEPIGTVVNGNVFCHAGISLSWATKASHGYNTDGPIDSLRLINQMAASRLTHNLINRKHNEDIFKSNKQGPLYYTDYATENTTICDKLNQVLKIMGVSHSYHKFTVY